MKRKIGVYLLLYMIVALTLHGCGAKEPKIRSAVMVASEVGVDEKAEAVEAYPAEQEELLLYGKALHFGEGDMLTVRWIYEEAGEYIILEDDGNKGHVYEFYSRLSNAGYPWPKGDYRVEVYVNNQDKPDATVKFKVE